jgi:hypothetical protein
MRYVLAYEKLICLYFCTNSTVTTTICMGKDRDALIAGGVTGASITVLMNAYDRAMYLHVVHQRHFLNPRNWTNPTHGMSMALISRTVNFGFYHSSVDIIRKKYDERGYPKQCKSIATGVITGTMTSMIRNPFNVIKFSQWNNHKNVDKEIKHIVGDIHNNYSYRWMIRGYGAIWMRDVITSTTYVQLRSMLIDDCDRDNPLLNVTTSFVSAAVGTALSSPFNYLKNIRYHDMHKGIDRSYGDIVRHFGQEVRQSERPFALVSHRFAWKFGILRVSVGIGLSQVLFDFIKQHI